MSLKALEIKTSIVLNLFLLTILYDHTFFDLYFLIPAVIEQNFATLDLAMPAWTPNNEANADIKTHQLTKELKIRKSSN